jgi:adenosylcobinamide kinase / adenosylcobinamide-phosphate guanylyltransferase
VKRSILFTGGARSGKSSMAQAWCETHQGPHSYLATAWSDPGDAEMAARIARHRQDRAGRGWTTVEVGSDLRAAFPAGGVALVDCLTLWLSGRCIALDWDESAVLSEVDALCAVVADPPCDLAVVSNEVGSGVVPEHAMGRAFRDLQGWANQRVARAAQEVVLCVCGLPMPVKPCAR